MNQALEVKGSFGTIKANSREELVTSIRAMIDVFNIGFYEIWPDVTPPPHGMASEEQADREALEYERQATNGLQ